MKEEAKETKKSFVLYCDYRQHLLLLTDEERGKLLIALLDYAETGEEPKLEGAALMAFSFVRSQMDRDAAKYAEKCRKRREAGKKGGRPKSDDETKKQKNQKVSAQSKAKQKNPDTENDTDNENDNDTDNDTDIKPKGFNNKSPDGDLFKPPDGGSSTAPPLTSSADAPAPYRDIVELYHTICTSYPELRTISKKRKQTMDERWTEYEGNLDTFRELFTIAEESEFLKGKNSRGWSADFNWLLDAENMPKVLEGNYTAKEQSGGSFDTGDFFRAALAKSYEAATVQGWENKEPPKTAAEDEGIKARAEALKQQFAGK